MANDLLIGQRIGQYQITREVGRGGMGVVYEAVHAMIGQRVAVKTLSARLVRDVQALDRFLGEARASSLVVHEGIPKIFDYGQLESGTPFIMMEFLAGELLRERLRKSPQERLLIPDAVRITRQIAAAMRAAHEKGVIHRDLKPDNVILISDSETPGGDRAKILDFGIALRVAVGSQVQGPQPSQALQIGTPAYMSPEQCQGEVVPDQKTDVYSLGIMFYEMLWGQPPFTGSRDELRRCQIFEKPSPLQSRIPEIPSALAALCERMLIKSPRLRPSMAEVHAELSEPLSASSTSPPPGLIALQAESRAAVHPTQTMDGPVAAGMTPTASGEDSPQMVRSRTSAAFRIRQRLLAAKRVAVPSLLVVGVALGGLIFRTMQTLQAGPTAGAQVSLPGGTFFMGSTEEEVDAAYFYCLQKEKAEGCKRALFEREQPLREVHLSAFRMDATEVTNAHFARWLNEQPGLRMLHDPERHQEWVYRGDMPLVNLYPTFPTYGLRREADGRFVPVSGYAERPVSQITWLAAHSYCVSLGQRLPTEAEWEFAARPRPGDRFPWGIEAPRCSGVIFGRLQGQECQGQGAEPEPVARATQDRSPQGIYDLAGNVAEWVQDRFEAPYAPCEGVCIDPVVRDGALSGGVLRVFRGGDWAQVAPILRSQGRGRWRQDEALQNVGFRCVS